MPKRTYIDTCLLIAAFKGEGELGRRALGVLDDPDRLLVVSDAVRLEAMPKARYHKQRQEVEFYEAVFDQAENIAWNSTALQRAHVIAEAHGVAAMDAIHVAHAAVAGVARVHQRREAHQAHVSGASGRLALDSGCLTVHARAGAGSICLVVLVDRRRATLTRGWPAARGAAGTGSSGNPGALSRTRFELRRRVAADRSVPAGNKLWRRPCRWSAAPLNLRRPPRRPPAAASPRRPIPRCAGAQAAPSARRRRARAPSAPAATA